MTDYTQRLEKMLDDVTRELTSVGIHDPRNPADWIAVPERVDANEPDTDLTADVVEDWDERHALVATLERQYNDVNRAIGKMRDGTFGTCEVCSAPIEEARLDANPAARTCTTHMNEESSLSL